MFKGIRGGENDIHFTLKRVAYFRFLSSGFYLRNWCRANTNITIFARAYSSKLKAHIYCSPNTDNTVPYESYIFACPPVNRSGTSHLAHETGTSLQSRGCSGGRPVTLGHPLAAQQPERDRAAALTLEPGRAGQQLEHHRLRQCLGPLSTRSRSFQRLHPRLKLQPRSETTESAAERQRRRAR